MLRSLFQAYREAFSGLPRGPWVLAAVCLVHRSGTMVLPFLTLYLTGQRGFTPAGSGVVLFLYGVGSVGGAFAGGHLTDRWGAHRVQAAALTLAGIGLYVLGQLENPAAIAIAVPLVAVAAEGFRPANGTAIAQQSPPERWNQAFALRRLAINLGMTLGPAVGGLLAARDYHLLFLVDAVTCVAAAGLLLVADRDGAALPLPPRAATAATGGGPAPVPVRSPWADPPFLALVGLALALHLVFMQVLSTFPLTLRDLHGFDEARIGSVWAINTILIVLVEMVLVRRLSAAAPLTVAAWGSLLVCGGFALLPFGHGYAFVAATVVVWTAGEMLTMPFLETVAARRGEDASRGSYIGAYNLSFAAAFGLAPLIGTAVYQRAGSVVLWGACGVVGVAVWAGLRLLAPSLASSGRAAAPQRPQPVEGPVP